MREPCPDCGCKDWDEYWGPVCGVTDCKSVKTICDERDEAVKARDYALLQVDEAKKLLYRAKDTIYDAYAEAVIEPGKGHDVLVRGKEAELLNEIRDFLQGVTQTRLEAKPVNWDKIIGAFPDMPDNPELLRRHPLTCGECRAEIRTDICPKCVALSAPVDPNSDLDEQT